MPLPFDVAAELGPYLAQKAAMSLLNQRYRQIVNPWKTSNPALFCTELRPIASSYPARIRTWTKRTKISCATVTLPGKSFSGA